MFELDYKSRKPIYEQICDQICELIAVGEWKDGQQLPPVRVLAKQLSINHNTVQKSIALLEQQGVLCTIPGKGTFVRHPESDLNPVRQRALQEIRTVLEKNRLSGVTRTDLTVLCDELFPMISEGEN